MYVGAKAKIVCSERGSYEKSKNEVVIYSDPTDFKGYFHVVLTHIKNLSNCRVKLYTSPVETCKNPTNVNKGLTGVPFSMYSDKNLKLFNVGPFYFTAGSKAAPATPRYWSSHFDLWWWSCMALYMTIWGLFNQFINWFFSLENVLVCLFQIHLIRCILSLIYNKIVRGMYIIVWLMRVIMHEKFNIDMYYFEDDKRYIG